MRLVSFRRDGEARAGVVVGEDGLVECADLVGEAGRSVRSVLEAHSVQALAEAAGRQVPKLRLSDVDLLPPVPDPIKILCAGANYPDHRNEARRPPLPFPTIFGRFADSQVGHGQPVVRPGSTGELDYEGELALVIGEEAREVPASQALGIVAGYSCYNDLSVRDWQRHSSQWTPGKNFAGVGAFGPWLVTSDEIPDPQALVVRTRVNGELRQEATVGEMLFPLERLIEYITAFTPLNPGDVIVTGTPGGVGALRDPPVFLEPGDTVEVEISGIGVLSNRIVSAR